MSEKQLKFKALGDIETKSLEGDNEETLVIEGIISTTNKDLYGDILTQEALESLKNQMIGLNVFLDHEYGYDDVVGVVRDARLEDNKLYGTVEGDKALQNIANIISANTQRNIVVYTCDYDIAQNVKQNVSLCGCKKDFPAVNKDNFEAVISSVKTIKKVNLISEEK